MKNIHLIRRWSKKI